MSTDKSQNVLRDLAPSRPEDFTTRPVIMGTHGMVTSGHYLASRIGIRILEDGGNAIDAGVAMGFALAVLEPYIYGIGGEVPILIYLAEEKRVLSLCGQGAAPMNATIEWFRKNGYDAVPGDGLPAAVVPDAVSTWISALALFGTMRLSQVLEPSIELADRGFPMYGVLQAALRQNLQRFNDLWPTSAENFLPDGRVPTIGEVYRQPDIAGMFKTLIEAEIRAGNSGRRAGLEAAHDVFYRGEIAERIVKFVQETRAPDSLGNRFTGLLTKEDLLRHTMRVEEPVSTTYREYEVFKCGPWTQGPVFLQQLNLLEGYDLSSMGQNSPEYIHLLTEVAKLAFAYREKYYWDPDFVHVPLNILLDKGYSAKRRKLIDPDHASMDLRPGNAASSRPRQENGNPNVFKGDTTHLDAVDQWGNMIAATPSGGWFASSPVITGLGFPLGSRMQMFSLDPDHANALMPGKRPRTTLTPSLVLRQGKPFMVFGTPGGDQQDQWTLQFFLNCVDFDMNMQAAVDAPTFHSSHFPASFYPHSASPGSLTVEGRVPETTISALREKGHDVQVAGDWNHGRVLGIRFDSGSGVISGVSTARLETGYAIGW